jgi:hypothetical protein
MQPAIWKPPVALTQQEEHIVNKFRKAKLFVFLRHHRHELFDDAFQDELASLYRKAERGHPPLCPALLALALILEAYTGVSDDEVIEATVMDRRWQLVLDCPDDEALLIELRQRQSTPDGRARLRERVAVEHTLAHVGQWQGRHARYRGVRKNLFDLRRCAVVHNLHVLARSQQLSAELQEAA